MPVTAPTVKVKNCESLGATVVLFGRNFDETKAEVARRCREGNLQSVHPFDEEPVMAGQGTVALEVLEQVPDLDAIIVPVGGGGLLAGVATVIRALRPEALIVGVEPENAACYAAGIAAGGPIVIKSKATFADGLAVAEAGAKTLLSRHLVDRVLTVSEGAIAAAMRELLQAEGATVEGAGAAAVAACLGNAMPYLWGKKVVCIVSGGNVDAVTHHRAMTGEGVAA
jgi:threonine dehydratase